MKLPELLTHFTDNTAGGDNCGVFNQEDTELLVVITNQDPLVHTWSQRIISLILVHSNGVEACDEADESIEIEADEDLNITLWVPKDML